LLFEWPNKVDGEICYLARPRPLESEGREWQFFALSANCDFEDRIA